MLEVFNSIFACKWIIWVIIAAFVILAIVDLIKRHTLSKTGVWYTVMMLIPAAFICACLNVLFYKGEIFDADKLGYALIDVIITWVATLILLAVILVLFVRNNIVPLEKNKTEQMSKEKKNYFSSKRLIIGGLIGSVIYTVGFLAILVWALIQYGDFAVQGLIPMLILLFIPILNIISIFYLWFLGMIWAVIVIFALGMCITLVPLMNGCIRYSIISNEKKSSKVIWSLLSLIPVFNFGLGIYYLNKMKKEGY